jgi:beta-glucosidase
MLKKIAAVILLSTSFTANAQQNNEAKITALLNKMTLEEKVGQMAQITVDVIGGGRPFKLDPQKLKEAIVTYKLGSVLNTSDNRAMTTAAWNEVITQIQNEANNTANKIPVIYGLDDIHGVTYVAGSTFFPQQIGQAATFNRELVRMGGVVTAYESRAAGVPWTFSPVLDLGVNPLWARLWETYGEDPYLASEMGVAFVKGVQGNLGKENLVTSLKHYLAYSDPKSGKDRSNAWIPEHYLREYHFPAFREAVKAGGRTVMVNSALINGVPTHINKYLITDVLKKEFGFNGFVVTDWQDIENIAKRDKIAKNNKEALMLAINAGIDMSMIPYNYKEFCNDLVALVKEGKVSQNRIDDAVRRILRVKYELDLFDSPVTYAKDYPKFGSAEFERAAYNTAAESITLLKNANNVLPISKSSRILVTGPNANSMRTLNGGWSYSWQGEKTEEFAQQYNTVLEAMRKEFGEANVSFAEGVAYKMKGKYFEDSLVSLDAVTQAAANVDYVVLCIGENSYTEKPGDLNDLNLSDNQLALANAVIKTGKKIILVLNEGRPRIISKIEQGAAAIVQTYLPGNYGGDALADILSGDINPSGKLPITYPRYVNALTNYIHKPSDATANPQGAYDYSADFNPQYQFGHGLSYTTFNYSNLQLNKNAFKSNETVTVSVDVKNNGTRSGKETVLVFVSDLIATLTPDVKRLKGFEKVELAPGETKTVRFNIPVKQLAFVNLNNKQQLEAGEFKLTVANLSSTFTLTDTTSW